MLIWRPNLPEENHRNYVGCHCVGKKLEKNISRRMPWYAILKKAVLLSV